MREKLSKLLGIEKFIMPENLDIQTEWTKQKDGYTETRLTYLSADNERVPAHLLIPDNVKKPCPVIICLQGHSTGVHISLGEAKFEGDEDLIAGGRDFAIQAVKEGYAALAIEQAAMGERRKPNEKAHGCYVPTTRHFLYGKTMIGQRVLDVSRAIDVLETLPEIDSKKIACMGNSGGGTVTFYAACMDTRIKAAMPSCSFCAYEASIERMRHCICNFIPGIKEEFEMGDLAALIAPRPLVVVAGRLDDGFLFYGVESAYEKAQKAYSEQNALDNLTLVVGEAGHQFYPEIGWKAFKEISKF